jgi:hypothetical protein
MNEKVVYFEVSLEKERNRNLELKVSEIMECFYNIEMYIVFNMSILGSDSWM